MSYKRYPIFLDLRKKVILVIGGGEVALQKVKQLIQTEANIHLIAEKVNQKIYELDLKESVLKIEKRSVLHSDLNEIDLLIIATSDTHLNRKYTLLARERNIWSNSVDDVRNCDFFTSSTVDHGNIRFAISSDGKFPGLTRALRRLLNDILPESDLPLLESLGKARIKLKDQLPEPKERMNVLRQLLTSIEQKYFNKNYKF